MQFFPRFERKQRNNTKKSHDCARILFLYIKWIVAQFIPETNSLKWACLQARWLSMCAGYLSNEQHCSDVLIFVLSRHVVHTTCIDRVCARLLIRNLHFEIFKRTSKYLSSQRLNRKKVCANIYFVCTPWICCYFVFLLFGRIVCVIALCCSS